jgi:hypothetical protein
MVGELLDSWASRLYEQLERIDEQLEQLTWVV